MITVQHLTRTFGEHVALSDITLSAEPNECIMLVGPNGAGKTTLMRILSCYLPATSGSVNIAGFDILRDSLDARANIGYLPESVPLYGDMTPREYFRFRGLLRRMRGQKLYHRINALIDDFELGNLQHALIRTLSQGQRVRVALADALLHEPPVVLLDDPLTALDSESRKNIIVLLQHFKKDRTLLLSTHYPDEVATLCTRYILLQTGKIKDDGTPSKISSPSLQEHFSKKLTEPLPLSFNVESSAFSVQCSFPKTFNIQHSTFNIKHFPFPPSLHPQEAHP